MLHAAQSRGTDAAGIAFQRHVDKDRIVVIKEPGRAEDLIRRLDEDRWQEIAASPRGLLHARAKTKGDVKNNANNHPVYGFDWVVVHNGHVNNDDELYAYAKQEEKKERFAEVDTAAIPYVLSRGGDDYMDSLSGLACLGGNITAAMWSDKWIDRMALVRLGSNDLYLIYDKDRNILYWTSTLLASASLPSFTLGKKLRMITLGQLNDERLLVLDPTTRDATQLLEIQRKVFYMPKAQVDAIMKGSTTNNPPAVSRDTGSLTSQRKKSGGTPGASDETKENKPQEGKRDFKWSREALPKWAAGKPLPMNQAIPRGYETYWKLTIEGTFKDDPKKVEMTVPTAYGNWYFVRVPGEALIVPSFRPHKRVKTWIRAAFTKDQAATLIDDLPYVVEKGPQGTPFDNQLALETFIFRDWSGNQHLSRPGYMCPWCGVIGLQTHWSGATWRCWFCRIKSTLPGV